MTLGEMIDNQKHDDLVLINHDKMFRKFLVKCQDTINLNADYCYLSSTVEIYENVYFAMIFEEIMYFDFRNERKKE